MGIVCGFDSGGNVQIIHCASGSNNVVVTGKIGFKTISLEEQERLIKAARQAPEPAAFGIIFDLFTGLRLGELCGLRWQNVDME